MALACNEALVVRICKSPQLFAKHKILAQWLECDSYVLPAERKCWYPLLVDLIDADDNIIPLECARDFFYLWQLVELIEYSLTNAEQHRIHKWMLDSNYLVTPPF